MARGKKSVRTTEDVVQTKPVELSPEEEKRAKMLATLAHAREVRRQQLAASQGTSARKGGSVEAPPPPQANSAPTRTPAKSANGKNAATVEVPMTVHPLPPHLMPKGRITAILLLVQEED